MEVRAELPTQQQVADCTQDWELGLPTACNRLEVRLGDGSTRVRSLEVGKMKNQYLSNLFP
jgi:hypothetical protein